METRLENLCWYLRNRKHVPCFHQVMETRVEVWENEKCCGNTSRRRVFPQLFQVLPNFHECFYNSIETRSTCLLFLKYQHRNFLTLTQPRRGKGKQLVNFDYQTQFLTNKRTCFLRTVVYYSLNWYVLYWFVSFWLILQIVDYYFWSVFLHNLKILETLSRRNCTSHI